MFIIKSIKMEDSKGELKLYYKMVKRLLGFIPPHFELFATIDLKSMKEFFQQNQYFTTHEKIDETILPYLRLYIAIKEDRKYCINFNTTMLLKKGVNEAVLLNIVNMPHAINIDDKQKILLQKVLKSIYNSNEFSIDDLDELEKIGFCNKDFYDLLDYATNFMAKSKMIEVYLK